MIETIGKVSTENIVAMIMILGGAPSGMALT